MQNLFHKLKLKLSEKEVDDFILTIVKQNVEYKVDEHKNNSTMFTSDLTGTVER